jgi:hypothetical protein
MPNVQRWSIDDIPFHQINLPRVQPDDLLLFVIASASLVESGADIYTDVLLSYFDESEAGRWLIEHWQHEELQHGRALRRYVETVWPELDWESTFAAFDAEYSSLCSPSQLAPTPTLELAARCVVETGTAALYRALAEYANEPVLKLLAGLIRDDEVRHYRNFSRFFHASNVDAGHGRWSVMKTLVQRLVELRNQDADCALRHVFSQWYPCESTDSEHFRTISRESRDLVMRHIAPDTMVRMFLQPLQLPPYLRNSVEKPCAQIMRTFMVN